MVAVEEIEGDGEPAEDAGTYAKAEGDCEFGLGFDEAQGIDHGHGGSPVENQGGVQERDAEPEKQMALAALEIRRSVG